MPSTPNAKTTKDLNKDDHIEQGCQAKPSVDGEEGYKAKGGLDRSYFQLLPSRFIFFFKIIL